MESSMETVLLVPVDDTVVFPNMTVTLAVDTGDEDRVVLVPREADAFASVGTIAEVAERVRLPGGVRAVALSGLERAGIGAAQTGADGALRVEVEPHPDDVPVDGRTRNLEREYRAVVEEILELRGDDGRVAAFVRSITEPGALADTSGYAPDLSYEQKVELLETIDVTDRLELALKMQRERLTELQVRARIRDDVQSGAEKQQREYFLRKQMESIRKELGDDDASVIDEYRTKIEEAGVPAHVRERGERSEERLDPVHAREVLDADHAGLEDVKDRIVEYIAVRKLRLERGIEEDKRSGAILTLIGPPGTGKTSIGESIARATDSPIDVLPVPGGPISVRMAPERLSSSMPRSRRSLRTAMYSTMRSFTSSRPAWSASSTSRACTGSSRSSERSPHGTAISQSRYDRIIEASPPCSPMRSSRSSSRSACSRTSSGMPASPIFVRYSSMIEPSSSPSSLRIDSICLRRKYSRCCFSAPDWTSSRMRRRTWSSLRRSRCMATAFSSRSVTSSVSRSSTFCS